MALPFYVEPTDPPSKQDCSKPPSSSSRATAVRESSIRAVAAEAGFTNPVLFQVLRGQEALALHCSSAVTCGWCGAMGAIAALQLRVRLGRLLTRVLSLLDESPEAVLFVNEETAALLAASLGATRKHSLIAMTRAFFDEGEVTKAVGPHALVAGFWGLLGQFARLLRFRGVARQSRRCRSELECSCGAC